MATHSREWLTSGSLRGYTPDPCRLAVGPKPKDASWEGRAVAQITIERVQDEMRHLLRITTEEIEELATDLLAILGDEALLSVLTDVLAQRKAKQAQAPG